MISLVSSFKIINVPIPDPKMAISVVDAVAANANGIQRLLAYGLSTVPIKDKLLFSNGPKDLPRNSLIFTILDNWVFDNFMLALKLVD